MLAQAGAKHPANTHVRRELASQTWSFDSGGEIIVYF